MHRYGAACSLTGPTNLQILATRGYAVLVPDVPFTTSIEVPMYADGRGIVVRGAAAPARDVADDILPAVLLFSTGKRVKVRDNGPSLSLVAIRPRTRTAVRIYPGFGSRSAPSQSAGFDRPFEKNNLPPPHPLHPSTLLDSPAPVPHIREC